MDTPYNRRVPVPPNFRRTEKKRLQFGLPEPTNWSVGWLFYIPLGIVVCFTALWYKLDTTSRSSRIDTYRPHYNIAGDVEAVRTLVHQFRDTVLRTDTAPKISSIDIALDVSADTLSAATSFAACHDKLVLEFAKEYEPNTACDTLFERILACQYKFTVFHEHHKRMATTCGTDMVKQVEDEATRIAECENQRSMGSGMRWTSPSASWNKLKSVIKFGQVRGSFQYNNTHGKESAGLTTALGEFSNRLRRSRLVNPRAELYRRDIEETYGRILQLLTVVGCGQVSSSCLCQSIDFEVVKGLHGEAALGVSQLASEVIHAVP